MAVVADLVLVVSRTMAAGGSRFAKVPGFDPKKYRPPPYVFEPAGLKLYKPKATVFDDEVVLREPEIHFSVKNREVTLR